MKIYFLHHSPHLSTSHWMWSLFG